MVLNTHMIKFLTFLYRFAQCPFSVWTLDTFWKQIRSKYDTLAFAV